MSKDVTVLFRRCTDWSKHNVQKDNGLLLTGAKPLIWTNAGIYCQLDLCKQTSVKFNRNSYICIQENAFENVVWKMAIILSGPQWVNMNQVFMLVYSRSVTMPKTRPELIAAYSIGTISAQSSSGKLWSEKKLQGNMCWVDVGSISAVRCRPNVVSTLGWCRPPTSAQHRFDVSHNTFNIIIKTNRNVPRRNATIHFCPQRNQITTTDRSMMHASRSWCTQRGRRICWANEVKIGLWIHE